MKKRAVKKAVSGSNESGKSTIKAFFRNNKKLIIILSVAVLLLFSFALYRAWINFHFLTTDDLLLALEPQDISFSVHYGEKPNVTFSVEIENTFFCGARCSYEFIDLSEKSFVDKGAFAGSGTGKRFEKEFQLSAGRTGSGQKIYSFSVQCNNIRTFFCPTDESKRRRSAFVTLNYDISDYERFLKDTLKDNITKLVSELGAIDIRMQQLNNRFFELGHNRNLNDIEDEKEILNNQYGAIVLEFENLARVWSEEDYLLLSELFNKSFDARISAINQKISELNSKIDNTLKRHNTIVVEINKTDNRLRNDNATMLFLGKINSSLIPKHKILLWKLEELKYQINANSFVSYDALENDFKKISSLLESFEDDLKNHFLFAYLSGYYYSNLENGLLCNIKGVCMNKTDFPAVVLNSLLINYDKIGNICSSLEAIKNTQDEENNKSMELMKNYNYEAIVNILENAKSKKTNILKKDIFSEIEKINASNETEGSLNMLINISHFSSNVSEEIGYGNLSESEALLLIQLNLSNSSKNYFDNYCKTMYEFNIFLHYGSKIDITEILGIQEGNFTSRIKMELTPNYPVCCVFGECKRCCTQEECKSDPSLYPILFLHGHSLDKDNSPDFSLDAFNKIQARLQEDGYISVGAITPVSDYSEINKGEWGLSSKPISVKGSYYLVSYYNIGDYSLATQKSENIETYSIRLKELIDLLKFRTGRDKVSIIAHSMGSLVARSYIQIFGDDSVDKLILIAAPNKGISGKISSYCPLLGEKKECNDMSESSIFIKKLNDPLKVPKNVKIHNLIGIGCSMDGKEGDGIITKENAELEYGQNYYINGTCEDISKPLHTQILNIDNYPEVYGIISSVLKS